MSPENPGTAEKRHSYAKRYEGLPYLPWELCTLPLKEKNCAFCDNYVLVWFVSSHPTVFNCPSSKELKQITSVKVMLSVTAACTAWICILRSKPMVYPLHLPTVISIYLLLTICFLVHWKGAFTKLFVLKVLQKCIEFLTERSINKILPKIPAAKFHHFKQFVLYKMLVLN